MPRRLLLAALTVVCGLCAVIGCTVNPVTGKSQLDLLGETNEIKLGADLYPRYTQVSLGAIADPALQGYVAQVGKGLAAVGHRPALPWEFNGVNDPAVNAYALPGGKVSITRGLLARFDSEDELAAVLGHEAGHVTARHSAQQYTAAMLTQLALVGAAIYMDQKDTRHRDVYMFGGMIGAQLFMARYSRQQERQADDLGLEYMVKAGYNPNGMVRVMEVLLAEQQRKPNLLEQMFASHPLSAERLATARQALARLPAEATARPLKREPYRARVRQITQSKDAYERVAEAQQQLAAGKGGEALGLLHRSVNEFPDDGILRGFLASAESRLERPREAMADADRAARDASKVFFVHATAGKIFLDGRRFPEALGHLDHADQLLADVPGVVLLRGKALEGMARTADAIAAYRKVRQLAPESEEGKEAAQRLSALGVADEGSPTSAR